MRRFIVGVLVGAALAAFAWWMSDLGAPPAAGPGATDGEPQVEQAKSAPEAETPQRARRTERRHVRARPVEAGPPGSEPFAPGEALLHVGEGYVFGADRAIPRDDASARDVTCLDLPGGSALLRCGHGGREADVLLGAIGVPRDIASAAKLVVDAPDDLTPGDVRLLGVRNGRESGIGLVRSAAGKTYRVTILKIVGAKSVLERAVRIAYAELPTRPGGGVLAAPTSSPAGDAPSLRELQDLMAKDSRIPGASFTNFLSGRYERLSTLPEELVLTDGKYLVLDAPLATSVEFNGYSGLVAPAGIAATGKVRIRSYTGIVVTGGMAGAIDVSSYAHVHVRGDVTGSINVRSYATIVIDGDLIGEVSVSSYTTLLLRGRLLGKLVIKTSNSSFWFEQWLSRSQAEQLAENISGGNKLHLRSSDVAAGTYTDWSHWAEVAVGEEKWTELAR